jgi:hypothetical protein
MQTQGLSFNPSAIFQTALVPPSLRQAPQIKEVSIKDRLFFCTELSPRFTLITYSIFHRGNPQKGREAAAPSLIKEIQEVQGGKKRHTMVAQSSPKMPK